VLQNALRYTGREKRIALSCTRRDREVVLSVSDNGPGIPKHEQGRVFEKFHRVIDPANPNVDGVGLGLSIVQHIVRAHQGRITLSSEPGAGATFHIALPSDPEPLPAPRPSGARAVT
jgi:two-component system phosphate regulon sensor histidine kinase PhoR